MIKSWYFVDTNLVLLAKKNSNKNQKPIRAHIWSGVWGGKPQVRREETGKTERNGSEPLS